MNDKKLITPPHEVFTDIKFKPDIKQFLIELRVNILKVSIDELINYMGWSNEKYYQQIVNGYKDKNGKKKYKQPTIQYLFTSLNYAMNNYDLFIGNKNQIEELIRRHIIKW